MSKTILKLLNDDSIARDLIARYAEAQAQYIDFLITGEKGDGGWLMTEDDKDKLKAAIANKLKQL